MTLIALPVSTRILEKMVPASVMTRASSWGISSLTFSCSWKVILMSSCVIPSGRLLAVPVSLIWRSRLIDSMQSDQVWFGSIIALRKLRSVS
ncbi:hypothetical protein F2Q69_00048044 [Brassica cretica]|uniref:Uncharacterized protein n=1 Tax=Brassica cretica TaxID=69181 RepID=A0A8S9Q636_BRACR|nr:hypothetical protein F2Q69_00048044 [Brassica cretica]